MQVHSEEGKQATANKHGPFEGFIATGQLFTPLIFWTPAWPTFNEGSSRIIKKPQWSKHKEFGMFGIGELCFNFLNLFAV